MSYICEHKFSKLNVTKTSLNSDVKITKYKEELTAENAADIVRDYDLVVDACDNLPTRYVMNDACYAEKKPLVHGSIFQFEGQAEPTFAHPEAGRCALASRNGVGLEGSWLVDLRLTGLPVVGSHVREVASVG